MHITIAQPDPGITKEQWDYVREAVTEIDPHGYFMLEIEIPAALGTVPCRLYGPAMGDGPIPRDEVEMVARHPEDSERVWLDPIVDRPTRPVTVVQVVGRLGERIGRLDEGNHIEIIRCYAGPDVPSNPQDPMNADVVGASRFWAKHALARI